MKIIKTRLEGAKGIWPDELLGVLWAYRTTVRTSTRETPFKLAYGSEVVIPVEVHMANHRVKEYQVEENEVQLHLNLDLIDEVRTELFFILLILVFHHLVVSHMHFRRYDCFTSIG